MGAPPPPPGYGPPPGYPPPGAQYAPAGAGLQENVANTLCYIPIVGWIIAIVFLLMDPYKQNRNTKFHAFQSIFLAAAMFVVSLILAVVWSVMWSVLPLGMWSMFSLLYWAIRLAFLAVWLFLMFKAYNNQRFVLPVIGPLAEKQAYSS